MTKKAYNRNIYLPAEYWERLKEIAEDRDGGNVNRVVKKALEQAYSLKKATEQAETVGA